MLSRLRYIGYTTEVEYLPQKGGKNDVSSKMEKLLLPAKRDKYT
jgi:hypothetical protein